MSLRPRKFVIVFALFGLALAGCVWAWQEGLLEPATPVTPAPGQEDSPNPRFIKFRPVRFPQPGTLRPSCVPVVRVVDGDTIRVMFDGEEEVVRLIGVNSPELMNESKKTNENQPGGFEAAIWLQNRLAADPQVRLEFDEAKRDQYGRMLAYAWASGSAAHDRAGDSGGAGVSSQAGEVMLNQQLVLHGHAQPVYYKPNGKYRAILEAAAKKH